MTDDPFTEDSAVTKARAARSFAIALARMDVSGEDAEVLKRMALPTWQAWVGAMQDERKRGTGAYRVQAAALMVVVNVIWESVCMTTRQDMWVPVAERMLKRLAEAVREGPHR